MVTVTAEDAKEDAAPAHGQDAGAAAGADAAQGGSAPLRSPRRGSHLQRISSEPTRGAKGSGMRFSTNVAFVPGHSRLPSFEPDLALLREETSMDEEAALAPDE